MKKLAVVTIFSLLLVVIGANSATSAVWYVKTVGSDTNSGQSWQSSFRTIQHAIDVSANGDEIWVGRGTFYLVSTLRVNKEVDLYGGFYGTESQRNPRYWETVIKRAVGSSDFGCIRFDSNSTIDRFTITNGKAVAGGGIYCPSYTSPTIRNCSFLKNSADKGGAIFCRYMAQPEIISCSFTENVAYQSGGGIFNEDYSSPRILQCTFARNNSTYWGGAISNENAITTIAGCNFLENIAEKAGFIVRGGAIYVGDDSQVTIDDCLFSDNEASIGGAIAGQYSDCTITRSDFRQNSATSQGGAVGIEMSGEDNVVTLSDCSFSQNSAKFGGAIASQYTLINVSRCTLNDNGAEQDGGAIRLWSAPHTISNCAFNRNTAGKNGGAISNYSPSQSKVKKVSECTFSANKAMDGGAIWNYGVGGIYLVEGIITNCKFNGNFANSGYGGAVVNDSSDYRISNCIFLNNYSDEGGGAIYNNNHSHPTITNSTFHRNFSDRVGGAIYNSDATVSKIRNSILWNNNAAATPEIYNISSSLEVTYCNIQGSYPGAGNINADPLFISSYDVHLQKGSPCIDAGDNSAASDLTVDIDNERRIFDGDGNGIARVDMGADEWIGCSLPLGHLDYCRDCGPCGEGEGDCDNNSECEYELECVQVSGTDSCRRICQLPVGHLDYCRDCGSCAVGEGDCDNNNECQSGLICAQVPGVDTCQSDICELPVGHLDYCRDCGPCDAGDGDCDNNSECQSGLICAQVPGVDTCQSDICELPVGHLDYCRDCGPCGAGQGDCDTNSECQSGLSCVQVPGTDVCCPHPIGHLDYCRDCGPCAAGQGDCDTNGECQSGLVCVQIPGTDTCQVP